MKKQIGLYTLIVLMAAGATMGMQQILHKAISFRNPMPAMESGNTSVADESRTINYADDRILLGNSHNAFVGKVLRKIGSKKLPATIGPSSQYEVNVVFNIKGNLLATVVVNQFEDSSPLLLQVGSTYVFVTRYYREEGLYIVVRHSYDYLLLTDDSTLSDSQLKSLAENSDRVQALQAAYPNEQLGSDVRDHMTWNAFQTRRYDSNSQLIDDTVELRLHPDYTPPPVVVSDSPPSSSTTPLNQNARPKTPPLVQPDEVPTTSPSSSSIKSSVTPTQTPTPSPTSAPSPTPAPAPYTGTPGPTPQDIPSPSATPSSTSTQP